MMEVEYEKTREFNYWCEQEGKKVYQCADGWQCWDCALIQSAEETI